MWMDCFWENLQEPTAFSHPIGGAAVLSFHGPIRGDFENPTPQGAHQLSSTQVDSTKFMDLNSA